MIDDECHVYRHLVERTIGPLDAAIPLLLESNSFEDFVRRIGYNLEISEAIKTADFQERKDVIGLTSYGLPWGPPDRSKEQWPLGIVAILSNKRIVLNKGAKDHLDLLHAQLLRRV